VGEALPALVALVGFLPGVQPRVLDQVVLVLEGLLADGALVGAFPYRGENTCTEPESQTVTALRYAHAKSVAKRREGRGLSPWLVSVEIVIMSFIHHEELTTSSALYSLRTSNKRLDI